MKNLFYASFVPGMQEIVARVVRERLEDVSVLKLLDGAILFETGCSYDRLNFFCFNNIFAVISIFEKINVIEKPETLIKNIESILAKPDAEAVISENNKKIITFRLASSRENKPVSINEKARQDIENFISRHSGLKVDHRKPDTEFWLLYRREGFSLFAKRLTRSVEKKLRPGELAPQLAWLLCRLAELKSGETALDPFCGYGSIPEAALKHFPIQKFYASDAEERCIKITRSRPGLKSERCEIRAADVAAAANFSPAEGFDAIVTDPPWGMYRETQIPLEKFYEETLALFSKILKKGGRAIILTAARAELENAAAKTRCLSIAETIPILVSGKKATVYKIFNH